jgi:hypothetical protein
MGHYKMKKHAIICSPLALFFLLASCSACQPYLLAGHVVEQPVVTAAIGQHANQPASVKCPAPTENAAFADNFDAPARPIIGEAGKMDDSLDPHWWLNSGAYLYRTGEITATPQGELAGNDPFRLLYADANPIDTDNGYHPQNILRLVTRAKFKNFRQQVFFNIKRINASASPNRNPSNGILFFHRYQDGGTLYYAGIRVDGQAVIKKKFHGEYTTLKSVAVYPGVYNHDTHPNLLPVNRWIGMRTLTTDNANGNVDIALYLKDNPLGPDWVKVLEVEDTGAGRILNEGHAGIRGDFMDIQLGGYSAVEVASPQCE